MPVVSAGSAVAWKKPQATISAPQATYDLGARKIKATGGTKITLLEAGTPRVKISAATLLYELEPKRVQADGAVEAMLLASTPRDKEARLSAPQAVCQLDGKTLFCPQGGRLTRGTFILEAATLSANLKTGVYEATGGHGSFELDEIKEFTTGKP